MAPDTEGFDHTDGVILIEMQSTEAEIYEFFSSMKAAAKDHRRYHPNGGSKHGFQRSWRPGKKGRR